MKSTSIQSGFGGYSASSAIRTNQQTKCAALLAGLERTKEKQVRIWLIKQFDAVACINKPVENAIKLNLSKCAWDLGHRDLANQFFRQVQMDSICNSVIAGRGVLV